MSDDQQTVTAQATVPLPSADLITYRFDQVDKQVAHLDNKLDNFTSSFATKEELGAVQQDVHSLDQSVEGLIATDNRQQGAINANRRYASVALAIFGIAVGAVTTYVGIHH